MEKALEILKHIDELYVEQPDFSKLEKMAQNNPERVQAWEDAFKAYDLTDVLNAVDEFWNYKSSKSKPSVHQLRAMLTTKKDVVATNGEATREEKFVDYASLYMARDIKLGTNRHLLPIYQRAVKYIVEDMLLEQISSQEWHQLDYSGRCARAMQLGLFNRFDDVLVYICQQLYGKDYQFETVN